MRHRISETFTRNRFSQSCAFPVEKLAFRGNIFLSETDFPDPLRDPLSGTETVK